MASESESMHLPPAPLPRGGWAHACMCMSMQRTIDQEGNEGRTGREEVDEMPPVVCIAGGVVLSSPIADSSRQKGLFSPWYELHSVSLPLYACACTPRCHMHGEKGW